MTEKKDAFREILRRPKRSVIKAIGMLEVLGFRVSRCAGALGQVFDLSCDSVYPGDVGLYVRVSIESVSPDDLDRVRGFKTPKKKEIWLRRFGSSKTDPGRFFVYRFAGADLVQEPKEWPLLKAKSSPKKGRAKRQKGGVRPSEAGG
jgi:hypothetical protein